MVSLTHLSTSDIEVDRKFDIAPSNQQQFGVGIGVGIGVDLISSECGQ